MAQTVSQPAVYANGDRPGRGVNHPPPTRAEVKESVELEL